LYENKWLTRDELIEKAFAPEEWQVEEQFALDMNWRWSGGDNERYKGFTQLSAKQFFKEEVDGRIWKKRNFSYDLSLSAEQNVLNKTLVEQKIRNDELFKHDGWYLYPGETEQISADELNYRKLCVKEISQQMEQNQIENEILDERSTRMSDLQPIKRIREILNTAISNGDLEIDGTWKIKTDDNNDVNVESFVKWKAIKAEEIPFPNELWKYLTRGALLISPKIRTDDPELKELVQEALKFFTKGDQQTALEKLWDAFEITKTLLDTDMKKSVEKLIKTASNALHENLKEFLKAEFKALTDIGNGHKIRHHKKGDQQPINSDAGKDYLFHRMLALIDFVLGQVYEHGENEDS
jgi:hypothetical protein